VYYLKTIDLFLGSLLDNEPFFFFNLKITMTSHNEHSITIPDYLLAGSSIDSRWFQGPFAELKLMPAKAKGKRFEEIAEYIFLDKNMTVAKPLNSDHDRIVDGVSVEIKGSTITKDTDDVFSFLQIRPDQDYEYLVLETFWFDGKIKFYRLAKSAIIELINDGILKKQHGGNRAESRTFCYNGTMTPFEKYYWFEVKHRGKETYSTI
jgi:hypothetical protein